MGRQVRFRANDQDVAALEAEVRARGAIFLAYYHTDPEPRRVETMADEALVIIRGVWTTYPQAMLYLVRAVDLPYVRLKYVETQGYWLIDQMQSPVLEYSRVRMFYETGTYDESGRWVSWGDFVDWAQSINDWIRRRWIRDKVKDDYVGPGAARELAAARAAAP